MIETEAELRELISAAQESLPQYKATRGNLTRAIIAVLKRESLAVVPREATVQMAVAAVEAKLPDGLEVQTPENVQYRISSAIAEGNILEKE